MASKSILDLFGRVIKTPLNGQPKLCMQLVKHLRLFSNESVNIVLLTASICEYITRITLFFVMFLVGRTTAKRSVLCLDEIGTRFRVSKNTSPYHILFHVSGNCQSLNRQVMVQSR